MSIRRNAPLRSPVRRESAPEVRTQVTAQQAKDLSQLKQIDGAAVDKYLASAAEMLSRGILRGPSAAPSAPVVPPPPGSTEAVSAGSAQVQQLLAGALEGMSKIASDGFVSEMELNALGAVQDKLSAALALQSDPVLLMLPDDVVQSLNAKLFDPMSRLLESTERQSGAIFDGLHARDKKALQERLQTLDAPGGRKRLTFQGTLRSDLFHQLGPEGRSADPKSRAQIGDLVAVGRSSGQGDMGVITGLDDQGVQLEILTKGGELGVKRMSWDEYDQRNPLPLGGTFHHDGQQFYVHGLDDEGRVRARGFRPDGSPGAELSGAEIAALVPQLTVAQAAPAASTKSVVAAGGAEQLTPAVVRGQTAEGGLFTSKGPNEAEHGIKYKDYNEDAAVLGVVPGGRGKKETFYAGAFDQAGGMGHSSETGAASHAAALCFEQAALAVAQGTDPKKALLDGHQAAVDEVAALNKGMSTPMMTTVASGVIVGGKAHVLACGDAQAMLFSKDGRLKAHTTPHNAHEEFFQATGEVNGMGLNWANGITRSIGGDDPAFQKPDLYEWDVKPGDFLVFVSDGVSDANLQAQKDAARSDHPFTEMNGEVTQRELGSILRGSRDAEDATAKVSQYAMDQVVAGKGKPDNTTAVVVQVK